MSKAPSICWRTYENLKIFCWFFLALDHLFHDGLRFQDPLRWIKCGLLDEANSITERRFSRVAHPFEGENWGAKGIAIIVVVAADPTSEAVSLDVHWSYNSIIYAFDSWTRKRVALIAFKDPIISDKVNS